MNRLPTRCLVAAFVRTRLISPVPRGQMERCQFRQGALLPSAGLALFAFAVQVRFSGGFARRLCTLASLLFKICLNRGSPCPTAHFCETNQFNVIRKPINHRVFRSLKHSNGSKRTHFKVSQPQHCENLVSKGGEMRLFTAVNLLTRQPNHLHVGL
jgi:hypothetical protein